jgi:hypothetical protein
MTKTFHVIERQIVLTDWLLQFSSWRLKTKNKHVLKEVFSWKMEVCVKNRKKMNVCPNDFSQIDAFIVPPKVHKSIHSCF